MKFDAVLNRLLDNSSHPARGAWIEIVKYMPAPPFPASHPARGAWIEIRTPNCCTMRPLSHPARGAWIEISSVRDTVARYSVAPRTGCVD